MKKEMIKIPANIKYLTEREKFIEEFGKPFELPNGILNKEIPGCGATTVALTDEHKTIICSPRNELLKNKHEQYPDFGRVDVHCRTHALACNLHQPEFAERQNIMPCPVFLHIGTHSFIKLLTVFGFIHIDEVHDNDTTHVS